jgi:hypothetical protein
MRRFSTFAFFAVIVSCPAFSEDEGSIVYLPAKDGKPAQTIRLPAGEPQAVIESENGDRPEQCPKEAFWEYAASPGELVNCGEGTVYEIQPYETTDDSNYTLRLVPSSKPKPGTDDPGASKSKPGAEPEVNP